MKTLAVVPARAGSGDMTPRHALLRATDRDWSHAEYPGQNADRSCTVANDDDLVRGEFGEVLVLSDPKADKPKPVGVLHVLSWRAVFEVGGVVIRGIAVNVVDLLALRSRPKKRVSDEVMDARREIPAVSRQRYTVAPIASPLRLQNAARSGRFAPARAADSPKARHFMGTLEAHHWTPYFFVHADIIPCERWQ
jgi:hypothetical protein